MNRMETAFEAIAEAVRGAQEELAAERKTQKQIAYDSQDQRFEINDLNYLDRLLANYESLSVENNRQRTDKERRDKLILELENKNEHQRNELLEYEEQLRAANAKVNELERRIGIPADDWMVFHVGFICFISHKYLTYIYKIYII